MYIWACYQTIEWKAVIGREESRYLVPRSGLLIHRANCLVDFMLADNTHEISLVYLCNKRRMVREPK